MLKINKICKNNKLIYIVGGLYLLTMSKKVKGSTKSDLLRDVSDKCSLPLKDVKSVLESLDQVIAKEIKANRPVSIMGVKIYIKDVKPRAAHKARNPFTGQEMMVKAKGASKKIKVKPLKGLKALV